MQIWLILVLSLVGVVLFCALAFAAWKLYCRRRDQIVLEGPIDPKEYPFLVALTRQPRTPWALSKDWAEDFWKRQNLKAALDPKKFKRLDPKEREERLETLWNEVSQKFKREQDLFLRLFHEQNKNALEAFGRSAPRSPAERREIAKFVDMENQMNGTSRSEPRTRFGDRTFKEDEKLSVAQGAFYDLKDKFASQKAKIL